MSESEKNRLSAEDRKYIKRKKQIELECAWPYMDPIAGPISEARLRERVRTTLKTLPKEEWLEYQAKLEKAWRETHPEKNYKYP